MAITDKTRKLLWGKSGSRCAVCRCSLVHEATSTDKESIIGDECHIIAKEINGPRGSFNRPDDIDGFDNLILLCKPHHKIVDDQPNTYTPDRLREIKSAHGKWVEVRLSQAKIKDDRSSDQFLPRITKGTDLMNIIANGNHLFDHSHDELETEEEVELISSFLQNIQDYGDLLSDLESGGRVRASFELSQQIKELEEKGLWVFAGFDTKNYRINNQITRLSCSHVRVLRSTNPTITLINLGLNEETLDGKEETP